MEKPTLRNVSDIFFQAPTDLLYVGRDNDNYMNGTVDDVRCLFVLTIFVCVTIVLGFLRARKKRTITLAQGIINNT